MSQRPIAPPPPATPIVVPAVISEVAPLEWPPGRPMAALDVLVDFGPLRERLRLVIDPADLTYLARRGAAALDELRRRGAVVGEGAVGAWSQLLPRSGAP